MTTLSSQGNFFLFAWTVIIIAIAIGCGVALREPSVYEAEVDFIDAVGDEVVRSGREVITAECECRSVEGDLYFSTRQCADLAEALVVTMTRLGYHTDFMRFLGGINDERPTEKPPIIPEATTLCPQSDGGIRGPGEVDGGTL